MRTCHRTRSYFSALPACKTNTAPCRSWLSAAAPRFTMCCSVLQYVAVCCTVLQFVVVHFSVLRCVAVCCSVTTSIHLPKQRTQHPSVVAVSSRVQCVAVCCTVLQCVAARCSALQCNCNTSSCVWHNALMCVAWRIHVYPLVYGNESCHTWNSEISSIGANRNTWCNTYNWVMYWAQIPQLCPPCRHAYKWVASTTNLGIMDVGAHRNGVAHTITSMKLWTHSPCEHACVWHTYICIHTYIHIYICSCTCIYIHKHIYIYIHAHTHTHTYTPVHDTCVRDMTHSYLIYSYAQQHSLICATRLIRVCCMTHVFASEKTHTYVTRESSMCAPKVFS